ncbi:MAG TPA: hypothetical protein VN522_04790 [Solirubrobacterales bacterium]|nr:hypothetical protein [Solirubrobacterales bacterium]
MSAGGAGVRRAAVLGGVTGARTFLAPAALALRGRLGKAAKFVLPVLAAGELVGDKLPMAPPRTEGPGLVGRVVTGAISGRVSGGARGARVGAAFALAATYPLQALRAQIVKRTPLPDIAWAVPEDLIAAALAATASPEPRPDPGVDGPKTCHIGKFSAHQHGGRPGFVSAAGVGVAAGVVGTAAMTSAQVWLYGLTGGQASEAPGKVGERMLGVKVRKEQRPALNTAMHVLYGSSWGKVFGLALGRGERAPGPAQGFAFGAGVWGVSLAMLPALGLAEAPWKQSPAALAQDLGFHLIYGAATAAAYEAFTA